MLWRMTAALPGRAVSTHTRFHQLLWPIGAWCFLSLLVVSPVWLLARACPVFLALLGPLRDGGAMLLFAAQRVVGRFAVEGCVAAWVAVGDRTWNCYKQTNKLGAYTGNSHPQDFARILCCRYIHYLLLQFPVKVVVQTLESLLAALRGDFTE